MGVSGSREKEKQGIIANGLGLLLLSHEKIMDSDSDHNHTKLL